MDCWSSQSWRRARSSWPGQVAASSPEPASQAAEEADVASRVPVLSALRRLSRRATVTTTANFRTSRGSYWRAGSSPWPRLP
ncbi:hypothetical protein GCM10009639_59540 [Kitasatospora putterlickiae]|uniref:Uncharacterized protein n=1 Tax=Kitasatospora putterlickiae TaxID=221725 RepID=A0ABN1YG37_9ACTN